MGQVQGHQCGTSWTSNYEKELGEQRLEIKIVIQDLAPKTPSPS